jgi:hypothetical protein
MNTMDRTSQRVKLRDGRMLGYAEYTRPWGFRFQDIPVEVHLWHGELDRNVLVSVGRYVADALPNCHATFFEKEGHMSLPPNHMREILSVLVA